MPIMTHVLPLAQNNYGIRKCFFSVLLSLDLVKYVFCNDYGRLLIRLLQDVMFVMVLFCEVYGTEAS